MLVIQRVIQKHIMFLVCGINLKLMSSSLTGRVGGLLTKSRLLLKGKTITITYRKNESCINKRSIVANEKKKISSIGFNRN